MIVIKKILYFVEHTKILYKNNTKKFREYRSSDYTTVEKTKWRDMIQNNIDFENYCLTTFRKSLRNRKI